MFTGIVQAAVPVRRIVRHANLHTLELDIPTTLREGLAIGASVAVNGCCLTVTELGDDAVAFDAMMETLRVTNLGRLQEGQAVNVERAARFGDEIGGHPLSGHVHDQVVIETIERPDNNCIIRFGADPRWRRFLMPKGYVALNGCSLTLGEVDDQGFTVFLIPETLRVTTFGTAQTGDLVNLEIDAQTQAIVETVERVLGERV